MTVEREGEREREREAHGISIVLDGETDIFYLEEGGRLNEGKQ